MNRVRRRLAAIGLASLLAFVAWPRAGLALELRDTTPALTADEAARAQALLRDVAARLPSTWRNALGVVPVQWRDDLPASVHGRAFAGGLRLRRDLLQRADDRPALAALVHELAHLYDRAAGRPPSRDPWFLSLAGWRDAPLRPWRTRNTFRDRSPDPYERTHPREAFAVQLEHYLLDDDYACRRPALARHFDGVFGESRPHPPCPSALPFVQSAADAASPLLALDPARVYAVDYLFAEGNDAPMSRWGHAMLRLVVCAPGRVPGPGCRLDLAAHLVLSFRAFVDDVQVSHWRGLTGDYPSRLFVLPLAQVVAEYTEVELRGLQSIPLRLAPGEIATLLERAALLHWSDDGRYAFIGNNCAVETARLLQEGVPRLGDLRLMSVTPTGLLRRLRDTGIGDAGVLEDRAGAMRHGYYFEPADAHQQALYAVAKASLDLPWNTAGQWLALPARERGRVADGADLRASAALLLLEQLALRRVEQQARAALKQRLRAPRRAAARQVMALEALLTRPGTLLDGSGHGLPQPAELEALASRSATLQARWQEERRQLLALARTWLPPAMQVELAGTEGNLAAITARVRSLEAGPEAQEAR